MTSHQTLRDRLKEVYYKEFDKDGYVAIDTTFENVFALLESELSSSATKIREEERVTENTSDGYHTFRELYEFRKLYNAAFFNSIASDHNFAVHKSKRHHDGELCFGGGWFIVMATLPTGQISNHYELKDWDLFNCQEVERANEWDGHTPQDVINRLTAFLLPSEGESNPTSHE